MTKLVAGVLGLLAVALAAAGAVSVADQDAASRIAATGAGL